MALHPRFLDPEMQGNLIRLADGKPGAVSRPGAGVTVETKWFPTLGGVEVYEADGGVDGHETRAQAKAAAVKFKEECRAVIAQANGEL